MVARRIRVRVRGNWHTVEVPEPARYPPQIVVDGEVLEVEVEPESTGLGPARPTTRAAPARPSTPTGLQGITEGNSKIIRSPMPGVIVSVSIKVWDALKPGSEICVMETMKMEQSVQVSREGTVRAVFIEPGSSVASGDPLIQVE